MIAARRSDSLEVAYVAILVLATLFGVFLCKFTNPTNECGPVAPAVDNQYMK